MHKLAIFCFLVLQCISAIAGEPFVTVEQGSLRGKEIVLENGKVYHKYSGIPYAKPPLGNLRFKPTQKADPWTGTYDAFKEGSTCITSNGQGNEDCLFLNVYVPQTSAKKSLPVKVYIHGGGFVNGDGNTYKLGPEYLMNYDVILVTLNYRLGALGFLNLEIEDAPGNMGLMDQVEALRWVNKNIAAFGGDPTNITISGGSAGSASAHYLILSDSAKGLFQRAILESGSALNPWAFQRNHLKRASDLCKALKISTSDPEAALSALRNVSAKTIILTKVPPEVAGQLLTDFGFVPSLEKKFSTHTPFLTELPITKMLSGNFTKVPIIAGINSAEGLLFMPSVKNNPNFMQGFENSIEKLIPNDLELTPGSNESIELAKQIKAFYFQNKPIPENIPALIDEFSDNWFIRGLDRLVKITAKSQTEPVYYYEYFFDENPLNKVLNGPHNVKGASHGDEMINIFKMELYVTKVNETETMLLTRTRMLEMWTNFIKFGNPTPEVTSVLPVKWLPVTETEVNFLSINYNLTTGINPEDIRMQFWNNVTASIADNKYNKHYLY